MANSGICSIPNCDKIPRGKGLCSAHYTRLRRHGDPLKGTTPNGEPMRWVNDVAFNHSRDECLKWPFSYMLNGYGVISVEGKSTGAHRYVCKLVNGEPPTEAHYAAHNCGKGHLGCVNPKHLEWKTPAGNQADRVIHGTHDRGERSASSKLTEADVHEIRRLKGSLPQNEIGRRFGISQMQVSLIHRRLRWAWLE